MAKKFKDFVNKYRGIILALAMVLFVTSFVWSRIDAANKESISKISYKEFIKLVQADKVDTVYYNKANEWMTFTLYNENTKGMSIQERLDYKGYTNADKRLVQYPAGDTFRKDLLEHDVILSIASEQATFVYVIEKIFTVVFPIIWVVVLVVMLKSTIGNDTNPTEIIQTSDVRFNDVIGHDEILEDVKFITKLIKDPKIGDKVGAKVPKGILLSGPPGTGKTLLAKAIAGEAGVPFLYQNASKFIDRFVGVGAKHVRELFKLAKQNAPCVLFIDEIDAVGLSRDQNRGTSEHDQTIDALLQEMDGFTGREGIFIIAATNRPDSLDSALTRAGRFDRQIVVGPPRDWKTRKEMFDHYLGKFNVSDDVDTENISKQTAGFTGADIAAVCNEASIIAVMNDKEAIDKACIEEAIDKKQFKGNRSKKKKFEKDRQIIAYHEAGHAVMSHLLGEPIARASIQSTTSGVGGAVTPEDKENLLQTKEDFEKQIMICYAGRASEEIKFVVPTTGASNDITQATSIMMHYIEKLGFDIDFGLLDMGVLAKNHLLNSNEISERMGEMSKKLFNNCKDKLIENYELVEKLAQKLLEVETLSGKEIETLFNE